MLSGHLTEHDLACLVEECEDRLEWVKTLRYWKRRSQKLEWLIRAYRAELDHRRDGIPCKCCSQINKNPAPVP
jgi:hypothetical protein